MGHLSILEVSGLLHISEISHEHIETPHNILNVSDQMKVMIIDLDSKEEEFHYLQRLLNLSQVIC